MKKIDVSFVIIAYNEETTIPRAIKSIYSQKNLENFEIVVVDDCSKDKTFEVVVKLAEKHNEIRLFKNKTNKGRGFSRNFGVLKSMGKYVAFVDADIILPNNWLEVCKKNVEKYDAVGGIAVPDGDVMYVYRKFNLTPKVSKHTTSVTGNNGFFKKEVLDKVKVDKKMKDGEDVDLTWRYESKGYKVKSIESLKCEHKEDKNFVSSIVWLYQQGVGSNKLLKRFKKIRLPDISFVLFLTSLLSTSILIRVNCFYIFFPFIFCLLISFVQMNLRFDFKNKPLVIAISSIFVHSTMIFSYFLGRLFSLIIIFTK